jgi:hypothetical protein
MRFDLRVWLDESGNCSEISSKDLPVLLEYVLPGDAVLIEYYILARNHGLSGVRAWKLVHVKLEDVRRRCDAGRFYSDGCTFRDPPFPFRLDTQLQKHCIRPRGSSQSGAR